MGKIKVISKKNSCRLIFTASRSQQLNEWELSIINGGYQDIFFPAEVLSGTGSPKLSFLLDGYCSLKEFLGLMPLRRNTFARILKGICENMKAAEEMHFSRQLILADISMVMINPVNWKIRFIYVPVQPYETGNSLQTLLADIAKYANFEDKNGTAYVHEYKKIVDERASFSFYELEKFVDLLESSSDKASKQGSVIRCPKCSGLILKENAAQHVCGQQKPMINSSGIGTGNLPWLYRCDSGEKLMVTKLPFSIGKGKADCCIPNTVVSRVHAQITFDSGIFYITDLSSKNGTFINGMRIMPSVRAVLHDNDTITLANEKLIFHTNNVGRCI